MRKSIVFAGLLAIAIPAAASAQPYDPGCVQQNQSNAVTGGVLGAIGGALIGNALGGHHTRGTDTAVGAVAGGVAGSAIASSQNHPCPAGYVYQGPPPPPPGPPGPPPPGYGFWRGAPAGIHERIDFMQDRINRAAGGGWLAPREIDGLNGELNRIRGEENRLRAQDYGRLRPADRGYLQSLLDNLSRRLHWEEHVH